MQILRISMLHLAQRHLLLVILLSAAAAGCRSTAAATSRSASWDGEAGVAIGSESAAVQDGQRPGFSCAPEPAPCLDEHKPVVCRLGFYRSRRLQTEDQIVVWGNSLCDGRRKLVSEICRLGLVPDHVGELHCAEDRTAGRCPPSSRACPGEESPAVCHATRYGVGRSVRDGVLSGRGGNECLAREDLKLQACRRNIRPDSLGEVVCRPDLAGTACTKNDTLCDDAGMVTRCRAEKLAGQALKVPLDISGPSPCETKRALQRLACNLDINPENLDAVVCFYDR